MASDTNLSRRSASRAYGSRLTRGEALDALASFQRPRQSAACSGPLRSWFGRRCRAWTPPSQSWSGSTSHGLTVMTSSRTSRIA